MEGHPSDLKSTCTDMYCADGAAVFKAGRCQCSDAYTGTIELGSFDLSAAPSFSTVRTQELVFSSQFEQAPPPETAFGGWEPPDPR